MAKKKGKASKELFSVTINGVQKLLTSKQLDKQAKVCTARDLKRMAKVGEKLFPTDEEFEEFIKILSDIRKRG